MSVLGQAMGTQRARKKNDFYATTDPRVIAPLLAHVPPGTVYAEPCAGEGDLIHLLERAGLVCDWALELEPPGDFPLPRWPIGRGNALNLTERDLAAMGDAASVFITNPPWGRTMLHALIHHLAAIKPTWMLFDASWAFTRQAAAFGPICTDVVTVGRVKWFENSRHDPPDDCAWYRFDAQAPHPTRFHFPVARTDKAAAAGQLALL